MDQLWLSASGVANGAGLPHREALLPFAAKIQFQQAVNPVRALVIPGITLSAQHLKQLLKTVPGITFSRFCQRQDHGLIPAELGLVKIHRPAQR